MPVFFVTPWRGACHFSPITISGQTGGIVQMLHISSPEEKDDPDLLYSTWLDLFFLKLYNFFGTTNHFWLPYTKKREAHSPIWHIKQCFSWTEFSGIFFLNWEINLNFYACVWCNWWKEIVCHEIYLVATKHALWPSGHLLQSWGWWSKGKQRHV